MLRIATYRPLTGKSGYPVRCTGRSVPSRAAPVPDRRSSLARAKRTDRTEARRRHREEQAATAGAAGVAEATMSTSSTATGKGTSKPAPTPVQRPGLTTALRGAFRPLDLRGDLAALPRLLVHWSFWGPALATVATTVVYLALAQGRTADTPSDTVWVVVNLAFQMFVFPLPAPAGAAFIAGFGAPRASWLIGLIIGVISAACFAVILTTASPSLTTASPTVDVRSLALQGFLVAPVGASLFAAAAAWYKRFLNLANPNRNQRGGQPAARPVQGRGDIKRDRLSRS